MQSHFSALVLGLFGVAVVLTGCGGGSAEHKARESSELKPLAILYMRYRSSNQGQPPPDEAAFKKFAQGIDAQQLETIGAKDLNSIFTSSRDKQPYVILYGPAVGDKPDALIAYEQQGAGGKRYVATSVGQIKEVDETEFQRLVPATK